MLEIAGLTGTCFGGSPGRQRVYAAGSTCGAPPPPLEVIQVKTGSAIPSTGCGCTCVISVRSRP